MLCMTDNTSKLDSICTAINTKINKQDQMRVRQINEWDDTQYRTTDRKRWQTGLGKLWIQRDKQKLKAQRETKTCADTSGEEMTANCRTFTPMNCSCQRRKETEKHRETISRQCFSLFYCNIKKIHYCFYEKLYSTDHKNRMRRHTAWVRAWNTTHIINTVSCLLSYVLCTMAPSTQTGWMVFSTPLSHWT